MAMSPKDAPFVVEVPSTTQDKPGWAKVGIIAAVGFVVGIAWPRVMGVRLGPSAPGESTAAASASAHGGRAPDAPPASVTKALPSASVAAQPVASAPTPTSLPPNITVPKGSVISCKTSEGETKKGNRECGAVPGIDALVGPRVRKIATCSGVEGQTGKLSLIVNADFSSGRFWYEVGKSTTLQNVEAVSSCLKTSFHGTSTTATPHEHARYTVAYTAVFAPGTGADKTVDDDKPTHTAKDKDKPEAKAKEDEGAKTEAPPPSSGEALVAWEVALVRDAPKTGGLVSRLPRGTKVKVGASREGWYQVKFGEGFANEGWVYRGAIGR